ncbi:MAG: hypothetical protein NTX28_12630 [Novosphingobium sp.]|nr:hypothetical protein [Novosphingobium sp.]
MPRNNVLIPLTLGALCLSACAGPVETRSGFASVGASVSGDNVGSVAVVQSSQGEWADAASAAVQSALGRHGLRISPDAPRRITVSVTERPADMAILGDDGAPLSPAKRQRLLQNCTDRTQRLLVVLQTPDQPPVRAWAEESHCQGRLDSSLPALARQAVDALYRRSGSVTLRTGQD